jgi:hypothetical protein
MIGTPTGTRHYFPDLLRELGYQTTMPSEKEERFLLLPRNLRLVGLADGRLIEPGRREPPQIVEGDSHLYWEGYDEAPISIAESKACLWEYLEKVDAGPLEALDFFRKWGVIEYVGKPDEPNYWPVAFFREGARLARSFVVTLVATDAGETVPFEILEPLEENEVDQHDMVFIVEMEKRGFTRQDAAKDVVAERRRKRIQDWSEERRQGRGLELQRDVLVKLLDDFYSPSTGWATWDERGRWIYRRDIAVKNIVWSDLYSLFLAPRLDVYTCGMCGRPFEYHEDIGPRRPRSGVRPLCSDECRKVAKKESNRLSWQRNKSRWRAPKSQEGRSDG